MDKSTRMVELKKEICDLLQIIVDPNDVPSLTDALEQVYKKITSSDVEVFEDSRYLLTTRDMQKIKEVHYDTPTWKIVKPFYKNIFHDLYVDIHPDTSTLSNGPMEDVSYKKVNCTLKIPFKSRIQHKSKSTRKKMMSYIKKWTGL